MTLSYDETKKLIEAVLTWDHRRARYILHQFLILEKRTEPEFYAGIIEHGPAMRLTSEQWFEILSRLPNRMLRSQLRLEAILSEEQLRRLPPAQG